MMCARERRASCVLYLSRQSPSRRLERGRPSVSRRSREMSADIPRARTAVALQGRRDDPSSWRRGAASPFDLRSPAGRVVSRLRQTEPPPSSSGDYPVWCARRNPGVGAWRGLSDADMRLTSTTSHETTADGHRPTSSVFDAHVERVFRRTTAQTHLANSWQLGWARRGRVTHDETIASFALVTGHSTSVLDSCRQ